MSYKSKIVTITIPDHHAETLSKWASVNRTINTAIDLLTAAAYPLSEGTVERDRLEDCVQELSDIGPALDDLHRLVREKIWEINRRAKA